MSNSAHRKEKAQKQGEKQALLKSHYVVAFGPKCGPAQEAVLRDLYEEGGMMKRSHVPGDPYATAFNEGARSVVLHIFEMTFGAKGAVLKIQEIETENAEELIE